MILHVAPELDVDPDTVESVASDVKVARQSQVGEVGLDIGELRQVPTHHPQTAFMGPLEESADERRADDALR